MAPTPVGRAGSPRKVAGMGIVPIQQHPVSFIITQFLDPFRVFLWRGAVSRLQWQATRDGQPMKTPQTPIRGRRKRGFERASGLLGKQIRKVGESRGFAVSRLLTHWSEIVGQETAESALPIKVSYGRGGLGATLTVLTTGARAPMLQADLPRIQESVNRCYGYAAISRIKITQTAPTGFAEGQIAFSRPETTKITQPSTDAITKAQTAAKGVADEGLRNALEKLGTNIISKANS